MLLDEQMNEIFKMLDTIYCFLLHTHRYRTLAFLIVLIFSGKGQAEFTELRPSVHPCHISLKNNLLDVNSK